MTVKQRNTNLDLLKGIAAIMIVFIHVRFGGGGAGRYISDIARFGVPVFFLTSGFFVSNKDKNKLRRSIVHVCQFICIAYALNLIRIFIENQCSLGQTIQAVIDICTWKHLLSWLLLNTTSLAGVAWFLWALLYCYCIHMLLYPRFENDRMLISIAVAGFLAGIFVQIIMPTLVGKSLGTNNVWLCGLPNYTTGLLINRNEEWIRNHLSNVLFAILATLGFIILSIGSYYNQGLCYLGSCILAIALFCLAAFNPSTKRTFLSKVGSKYAFYVYIMHPIFMHVLDAFADYQGWFQWIRPLIVLALTLVSAIIFYNIIDLAKDVVSERKQCKN